MKRIAVFVDAGYLFAQASIELIGQKSPRSSLALNSGAATDFFRQLAGKVSPSSELLRVYWYDGTSTGPTAQQLSMAHQDDVKLRLGFVNSAGEQKGVDSLIVTDMINLARNGAMTDALLVSGDEDLRVGVQHAQEFGVRVHLIAIGPPRNSQSRLLMAESDTTRELRAQDLGFLRVEVEQQLPLSVPSVAADQASFGDPLAMVARRVSIAQDAEARALVIEHYRAQRKIPSDIDRELLVAARTALGGIELDNAQKKLLRTMFIRFLEQSDQAPPNSEDTNR